MAESLLFIPDISGYTKFVQNTEIEHSQHVIAELLEVLIKANTQNLKLAEVEGDALFFYKEGVVLSQEKLLAQIETMFTSFYSHLKVLEKNRICPCNACATAPDLQLKIIAHSGELQFITVQGKRKPFGQIVIEAHRLLKNSISSNNYALLSEDLSKVIGISNKYKSQLFNFSKYEDVYDEKNIKYLFSEIDKEDLKLTSYETPYEVHFDKSPILEIQKEYSVSAGELLEYITNYSYRHHWVKGVNEFVYNPDEVTRLGTEHVCVIDGKRLNFTTVTKSVESDRLIYGEHTTDIPVIDGMYQFYTLVTTSENSCKLILELYPEAKSIFKKIMLYLVMKRSFRKSIKESLDNLEVYVNNK
ncbi:DUF2652 domain-containing protein [Aquimarina sp. AD1]|uniref:DUF2652 domain-containing protein n=1 Tax=Aquimarina sp. (strain AD1) TaxID=1714848 RepID=UPI000E504586|nr:DUF2652 domain-containing protein [Aquimarina sp. AD1]AXT56525.1 DUF2652 domain-containing protein [Aquimarina sp. AD1]RKN34261.1 DUF2652 domain-containing protein [Aquimarina sp. AD1]